MNEIETRLRGPRARCPHCGSESVQVVVIPTKHLGKAAVGEFLLGTSAGVAAGGGFQLGNACASCGVSWQPGTDSVRALRSIADAELAASPFNAARFTTDCTACLDEIPANATACRHCGAVQSDDALQAAIHRAKLYYEAASLPAKKKLLAIGPVVAKCTVCLTPLTEGEMNTFKNRPFCKPHFERAIAQ
jgi:hypothetical protein